MSGQHNFLTNTILVTIICGMILGFIGNYILQNSSTDSNNNIKTCDKDVLQKIASRVKQDGRNGYLIAFTGNLVSCAGILFLLILSTLFSVNKNSTSIENIKSMINSSMPIFFTLMVITYTMIMHLIFKDSLIIGNVANQYYSYLSFSSLLILMQIVILIKYIKSIQNKESTQLNTVLYTITFLNIIVLGIMNIILKFFSTDG